MKGLERICEGRKELNPHKKSCSQQRKLELSPCCQVKGPNDLYSSSTPVVPMPSKRVLHLRRLRVTLSLLLFCIGKSAKGFFWLPSLSSLSSSSHSRLSPKMTDTNKQTTKSSSSLSSTTKSSESLLSDIHDAIELVTQPHDTIQQQLKHKFGLTLRQIVNWEDNNNDALVDGLGDKKILVANDHKKLALPLHFCLSLNGTPVEDEGDDDRVTSSSSSSSSFQGLVTFYMAYSTWEGRMLYVDHLSIINPNTSEYSKSDSIADIELLVLQSLARIAIHLNCARLMWRVGGIFSFKMYGWCLCFWILQMKTHMYDCFPFQIKLYFLLALIRQRRNFLLLRPCWIRYITSQKL